MSEGDLGQLLRGSITLFTESRARDALLSDAAACADTVEHVGYPAGSGVGVGGGVGYGRAPLTAPLRGERYLCNIICVSTPPPRLERKQRDSRGKQTAETSVFMPEKTTEGKTTIFASRKAPDAESDLHKKTRDYGESLAKQVGSLFIYLSSSFFFIFLPTT